MTPTTYSRTRPTYAAASQRAPTGLGIVGQMRRTIRDHIESLSELHDPLPELRWTATVIDVTASEGRPR